MTKSLLRIIVLSTGLLVGLLQLQAQSRDKIEPFYPEVRALCDSVLSYISTPDDMKEPFILLLRKYGGNADQMYRAAEYFASKDNYSCSQFCIERAFGKKMKHTEILQLRAQIYERVGNTALASNSYDGILQVDSLNHYALMKAADVDKYQNAAASFERLLLVKEKYPDDIEADKQLGYHYNRLAFEASRDSTIKANWRLSVQHYGNWFFATPADSLNKSDFYCNQYITNLYNIEATKKEKKDSKDGKGEVKDFNKLVQVCNILEPHITRPIYSKNIKA
jgi:tetratricopeptide (TPR) repeat protein